MTDDSLATEAARLPTADGGEVTADLVAPARPWAGAVVCHPHPAYGGDRHNPVVDRVFRTLGSAGVTAARFDFRYGHDRGEGAPWDVVAGIDLVAGRLGPDRPLWLVGYSFGADVALSIGDERVAGWAAVAAPLRFGSTPRPEAGDRRPVLVLAAEHDQFHPPERVREAVADWPQATVTVVPMADHFLADAAGRVAEAVLTWIQDRSPGGSGWVEP